MCSSGQASQAPFSSCLPLQVIERKLQEGVAPCLVELAQAAGWQLVGNLRGCTACQHPRTWKSSAAMRTAPQAVALRQQRMCVTQSQEHGRLFAVKVV